MNSINFKQFRADYIQAVKQLEEKYGVKCSIGTITYDKSEFRFKTVMSNANVDKQERVEIKGGQSNYLGKHVIIQGKSFTVVDYKERNWKMPYIIENQKGKRFKVNETTIKNNLIK